MYVLFVSTQYIPAITQSAQSSLMVSTAVCTHHTSLNDPLNQIKPPITCPDYILHAFQLVNQRCPIGFPVFQNSWKEKSALVVEKGSCLIHSQAHVLKHEK